MRFLEHEDFFKDVVKPYEANVRLHVAGLIGGLRGGPARLIAQLAVVDTTWQDYTVPANARKHQRPSKQH